ISLSAVDLAVTIRVENKNPVGATLESCPFSVSCEQGGNNGIIATGETGSAKIPGNSVTDLPARVSSKNAALLGALAGLVLGGKIEVTIAGTAKIKFLMIPKEVPFSRTVPVTRGEIVDRVTGKKPDE
ncbi:MAG: LEA type 2 family protein, partial [Methanoregula sp.]